YLKVTQYLIEQKHASANGGGDRFNTPFLTAIKYGREDLAHYLLSHGATPQLDKSAGEALYSVAGSNNIKMTALLLEIGFKADQQTLQHAIYGGNLETSKLLIEKGGVKVDDGKQEVLMLAIAATKNAPEMIKLA